MNSLFRAHYSSFHILSSFLAFLTLSGRIGNVVASHAEGCKIESRLWLSSTDLYYALGAQGVLPMWMRGATSQLNPQSLTLLSVAGCGRLHLGVPHWATSAITQVVDN